MNGSCGGSENQWRVRQHRRMPPFLSAVPFLELSPLPPKMAAAAPGASHVDPRAMRSTQITSFKVYSRVRPFIPSELTEGTELRSIIEMLGPKTLLLDPKENYQPKAQFEFDDSLWSVPPESRLEHAFPMRRAGDKPPPYVSQRMVYDMVAKGCAGEALRGFNTAIMSYGQTGSGKTYTMMGQYDPSVVCGGEGLEGIIPRVCHEVFETVDIARTEEAKKPESQRTKIIIKVTFVEIYMEKVRDLLDVNLRTSAARAPDGSAKMKEGRIRLDPETGPYVEDVTSYEVETWAYCCMLLERGSQQRTTSANLVHQQSSRSHAIFQITLNQQIAVPPKDRFSKPGTRTTVGRINLVDLAGSERGGFTDYVKESSKINTSLLALRRVIDCLVERQNQLLEQVSAEVSGQPLSGVDKGPPPQVPFRDSVLTWLLSDSIGGNARTTMIAALSPHAKNYGDTLATLQWSSRARNLVTVVKANTSQETAAGFHDKAAEVSASLMSQRHNVDSIRSDLSSKQQLIERLESEIVALMKRNVSCRKEQGDHAAAAAAITIHRFLKRSLQRKLVAEKKRRIDDDLVELERCRRHAETLESQVVESQDRVRSSGMDANGVEAALAAEEEQLAIFDREEATFSEAYSTAKDLHTRGMEKVNTERDQHLAARTALSSEVTSVRSQRERCDGQVKSMLDALATMEATVNEYDEATASDVKEKTRLAKADRDARAARVAELRQRKAALEAQKADLTKKLDAKKKKK